MSNQVFTSTPKHQDETETTALREQKWQNIIDKAENFDDQRKQRFYARKPFESKENRRRGHFKKSQKRFDNPNYALAEKRRKQAIESMKIAEQRRIRKMKEQNNMDKLAEELEMMDINNQNDEFLPDGRLKLSRKELQARKIKQARIRQYYEDQQAKKKKFVSFRGQVSSNDRSYRLPRKFMANKPRKIVQKQVEVKDNDEVMPSKPILRYTKDQLREMCPFGYYFFK